MQTGEDERGLHRVLDFTRAISFLLLFLHYYFYCYGAFKDWSMTCAFTDRLLQNIAATGIFDRFYFSKGLAIVFLGISTIGAKGRKDQRLTYKQAFSCLLLGLLLFFTSRYLLRSPANPAKVGSLYIGITSMGYLLILTGGNRLSRIVRRPADADPFNRRNETFPQEERRLENAYSVNIPGQYLLKGQVRNNWINIINPFRGLLIMGNPGSGKTWFLIEPIIKLQIKKGFCMLVYDFKYDDLSRIAYNSFLRYRHIYPGQPSFYNINFDDLNRTNRANPLDPATLFDITDATESARTILLGLNKEWIEKQGEFFVESPINFITALIWYLRKYQDGRYCTWPHVIEMAQLPFKKLFSILPSDPEIHTYINSFVGAYKDAVFEQLQGQVDSARISLARLSSPALYYVLTGNDFTLDLNNPLSPKVLALGNNPQKTGIYGAILSVYINTITRLANRKGMLPLALNMDEFSSIMANTIDKTIATGRSNRIAVTIAVQDYSQLKLTYGRAYAEVIVNICGNIISGQVTGESAKLISERFGRIMQDRESYTITSTDTNFTHSRQPDQAIPVSRIAALSSGEFVGIVADNPDQEIPQKSFCCKVQKDYEALKKEEEKYVELPQTRKVTKEELMENYLQVKEDVIHLVEAELDRIMNDPNLTHLLLEGNS